MGIRIWYAVVDQAPLRASHAGTLTSPGFTVFQTRVSVVFKPISLLVVLMAVAVTSWPALAHAQFFRQSRSSLMAGRFVTLPRVLAQQLREAENAIMESRYNDAVVRLGDLLAQASSDSDEDELLSQDFFLDAGESRVVGTPLNKSFKV